MTRIRDFGHDSGICRRVLSFQLQFLLIYFSSSVLELNKTRQLGFQDSGELLMSTVSLCDLIPSFEKVCCMAQPCRMEQADSWHT